MHIMSAPRCFEISGFPSKEKESLYRDIELLGGTVNKESVSNSSATHIIMKTLSRSEKFLCSISRGLWVLKPSYIEKCKQKMKWLSEEFFEWRREDCSTSDVLPELLSAPHRARIRRMKTSQTACQGWRCCVLVAESCRKKVYKRILTAAGAEVVNITLPISSTRNLPDGLAYAFTDEHNKNKLSALAHQGVHCVKPEYIGDYLIKGEQPNSKHYVIPYQPVIKEEPNNSCDSDDSDVIFISEQIMKPPESRRRVDCSDVEFICATGSLASSSNQRGHISPAIVKSEVVDKSHVQGQAAPAVTGEMHSVKQPMEVTPSMKCAMQNVISLEDISGVVESDMEQAPKINDSDERAQELSVQKIAEKEQSVLNLSPSTASKVIDSPQGNQTRRINGVGECSKRLSDGDMPDFIPKKSKMEICLTKSPHQNKECESNECVERNRVYMTLNELKSQQVAKDDIIIEAGDATSTEAAQILSVLITKQLEIYFDDPNCVEQIDIGIQILQSCVSRLYRPSWTTIRHLLNILTNTEKTVVANKCYYGLRVLLALHPPHRPTVKTPNDAVKKHMKEIYLKSLESEKDLKPFYMEHLSNSVSTLLKETSKETNPGCRLFVKYFTELAMTDASHKCGKKSLLTIVCETKDHVFPQLDMSRAGSMVLIKLCKQLLQSKEIHCAQSLLQLIGELAKLSLGKESRELFDLDSPNSLSINIIVTELTEAFEELDASVYESLLRILPPWLTFKICQKSLNNHTPVRPIDSVCDQQLNLCILIHRYFYMVPNEVCSNSQETKKNQESEIRKKVSVNMRKDLKGETPLHKACIRNEMDRVKALIHSPDVDVNSCDNYGWTPLHEACNHGHIEVVKYMLKERSVLPARGGFDLHASSKDGITPLHDAVSHNHKGVVNILLKYGGAKLLTAQTKEGKTAIELTNDENMRAILSSASTISHSNYQNQMSMVKSGQSLQPMEEFYKRFSDTWLCSAFDRERYSIDVLTALALYIATAQLSEQDFMVLNQISTHIHSFKDHMAWLAKGEPLPEILDKKFESILLLAP